MDHKPFEGEVFEVQVLLRHYLCPFLIPMVTNDKINSLFYLVTHHSWNWFFRKTMTLWINKLFKKYLWEYEENIIDGDPVVTSAAENRIETILSIKWIRVGRKWNVTWLYKPCHWTQKSKIGQRWPWNWSKRNSSPTGYDFLIWVKNFDFLSKKVSRTFWKITKNIFSFIQYPKWKILRGVILSDPVFMTGKSNRLNNQVKNMVIHIRAMF